MGALLFAFYEISWKKNVDYDYLSLQLSFYLASWGMYRGSSFLLQKDYKVHIPAVKELLNEKYDNLAGIKCIDFRKESNQELLKKICEFLNEYYNKIREDVTGKEFKNDISSTLITKILMGIFGCVPAYDRYFIAGIKKHKVAIGNFNINSIMQIIDFYEQNHEQLEDVRKSMKVGDMLYPQMKIIDMGFWQLGFEEDMKLKTRNYDQ